MSEGKPESILRAEVEDNGPRPGFRGLLSIPDYRRLTISNTLWWQSMWMEMIVVGWLVLEMTDSAWRVALIGFYRMAPLIVVGLFSGSIIDRFGRRRIMLAAQSVSLATVSTLATLLWLDRIAFVHFAVGASILGVMWSLDWTARRSMLPDLLGRTRTVDGMLLEGFVQNIARSVGPFLSGALIEFLGAPGCYTVLAVNTAISLIVLTRLSGEAASRSTRSSTPPWTLIIEGLHYVRRNQPILGVLLITVIMNFFAFPYMTMLPVFARDILHQGPVGLGLLGTATGIGFFVGLFGVNRVRHRVSIGWIYASGSFSMAALLVGFSVSTNFHLSLALLTLSGIGQACFGVLQSSIVLLSARDEMRNRAMGVLLIAIGGGPLGRLQVGGIAQAVGPAFAVGLTCSLAAILVMVVAAVLPGFRATSERRMEQHGT